MAIAGHRRMTMAGDALALGSERRATPPTLPILPILVVDDDLGMRRSLAILLRRARYRVSEASSVAEAMVLTEADGPRLIIADLRMQTLTGLDLLAWVRACHPEIQVVIVTAFGSPENRAEAERLGAAGFLEKPLRPLEFLTRVRALLRQESRAADED
jgi:DNA-binding response OmpR family regulator